MLKITPGKITKIVLFIIFIIVVARLLYAILVVVPDHPEKNSPPIRTPAKSAEKIRTACPETHPFHPMTPVQYLLSLKEPQPVPVKEYHVCCYT
ncbi:protein of uncharacterized function (DUF2633) [Serratia symbiotica]|uniref:Protein of uncharacterized function (DUF2633) n=1 Tax=Serratia symbiotica TaxID=138074 RepID=A0A455VPG7_9GAMM|nr:protein of uncharacterized function (DUF2633) [Serratia symbiotica]